MRRPASAAGRKNSSSAPCARGKAADGSNLYPAFPYPSFTKISDQNLKDLYAFLESVAASSYAPPDNEMGFPFNQRSLMGIWNALFFDNARFEPDPVSIGRMEPRRLSGREPGSLRHLPYTAQRPGRFTNRSGPERRDVQRQSGRRQKSGRGPQSTLRLRMTDWPRGRKTISHRT